MSLRFFFPPAWFMLFSHPGMSSSSKVHLSFQVQPPGWVWSVCFSPFSEIPVSLKTTFLRSILIFCVHLVHCFKFLFILPWCASNISPVYSPDNGHKQYCIHLWICVRWISLHQSEGFHRGLKSWVAAQTPENHLHIREIKSHFKAVEKYVLLEECQSLQFKKTQIALKGCQSFPEQRQDLHPGSELELGWNDGSILLGWKF